jgi:DNA-binding Lrp family transcriptional regulator
MDQLDLEIMRALRDDGRKRFLDIAGDLGVSDATIHKRVKKLMDEGFIKGFEAVIDDSKLGYGLTAFIEVGIQPGEAETVVNKLRKIDGILDIHEIHGRCDILLKVRTRNLQDLRDKLVNQVRSIDEVTLTEAFPVMKVIKEERGLETLPDTIETEE